MQEVTINLSDEVYQRVLNYAQEQETSVEEVIQNFICSIFSEEPNDFQEQIESNSNKSFNLL